MSQPNNGMQLSALRAAADAEAVRCTKGGEHYMIEISPPGWGSDELSEFIDHARGNQFATFVNASEIYEKLSKVDDLFSYVNENLRNNQHRFPALFLLKAHSSFRGACRLAMSGQLPESYMVIRGALESALYGFHFFSDPDSIETWANRNDSLEAKNKVRNLFKLGRMLDAVETANASLGKKMKALYERTIDYGAHPNSLDLFTNLGIEETEEELNFNVIYLAKMNTAMELALKSTAQAGLLCLHLFSEVFATRFDLIGMPDRLKNVSKGL